jgi:NADH-quinone oxidoreductase subunit A
MPDPELKYFIIFILISFLISLLLPIISFLLTRRVVTRQKISPYECGFEPFGDARIKVTVHFYLIAILFLVFDLEVIFLFPWCFAIHLLKKQAFWSMLYFFFVLVIGFIYEWRRGALEW